MRNLLVALINLFMMYSTTYANGQSSAWFGGTDLDYWREGKKIQIHNGTVTEPLSQIQIKKSDSSVIRAHDSEPFDWKNYEDPKNILFFDDGGTYIPPRPWREVVANPSPENQRRYRQWLEKKLEVSARAQGALFDSSDINQKPELKRNPSAKYQEQLTASFSQKKSAAQDAKASITWADVSVVYFYQSSCPHCQKSTSSVERMRAAGARVIPVQLDTGKLPPLHANSVPYDSQLRAEFPVSGTPTWVFRVKEKFERVDGYAPLEILEGVVARLSKNNH